MKRSTVEMNRLTIEYAKNAEIRTGARIIMSGKAPTGETVGANERSLLKNGRPWFPVMGEFHYSRYPRGFWDESILKMKACGLSIVGTYVFWIHHEEIEKEYDWSGNRDLRRFIELCAERNMSVLLRIGPWSHGECRNGGFPDWLLRKPFAARTNDPRYFSCVRMYFREIYNRVEGLLFKDGGPIIGVQIENEYGHCGGLTGEEGLRHMKTLKRLACEEGFDVPLYTATGWGGAIVVEGEMLPVMSAYADAPWTQHQDPLPPNGNYRFSYDRNDLQVGSDLALKSVDDGGPDLSDSRALEAASEPCFSHENNPYLMAELGSGIMVTGHRRPVVSAADSEALALVKLGSGAKLLGYYMFHGGTNPVGKLGYLQESRNSGSPNDLPLLSYDFQTAIGEYGRISDTYRCLKILHLFLADYGSFLTETETVIPENQDIVRHALRVNGDGGFLFLNNYQRGAVLPAVRDLKLRIAAAESSGAAADVSEYPVFDLDSGRFLILPYGLRLGGIHLCSATVQPLCSTTSGSEDYRFFFAYPEIPAVYLFDRRGNVDFFRAPCVLK